MRKLVLSAAALLAMGLGSLGTVNVAQAYDPFWGCGAPSDQAHGNKLLVCLVDVNGGSPVALQFGKKGTLTLKRFKGWLDKAEIVQFSVSYKSDGTIIQIRGFDNSGKIFQWGDFSSATIKQFGGARNDATIFQSIWSDFDSASITQKGGYDNGAWIGQNGDRDHATITQKDGVFNDAGVSQNGNHDSATVTQIGGFNNDAHVNQDGNGNSATVAQVGGALNDANVNQDGNGNSASVKEVGGFNNDATVTQNGNGGAAAVTIIGGSNNHPVVYQN